MSSLSIALILGVPLVLFMTAIGLMIWRAFFPKQNQIQGLTDRNGQIVSPSIHLGVSIMCLSAAVICAWRLIVASAATGTVLNRVKERLDIWALLLISTSLALQFFKQYKKFKSARANGAA